MTVQMSKGWKYLSDYPEDSDDSSNIVEATASNAQRYGSSDGNGSWYYFDSNGKPKYLKADATSMSKATVRIQRTELVSLMNMEKWSQIQVSIIWK